MLTTGSARVGSRSCSCRGGCTKAAVNFRANSNSNSIYFFSFCGSSRSIAATARSDLSLSLPMSALARAVGQSDTAVKCQRSQLSPCVRIAVPSCLPASDACFACPAPCLGLLPSMYGPDPIQACVGGFHFETSGQVRYGTSTIQIYYGTIYNIWKSRNVLNTKQTVQPPQP